MNLTKLEVEVPLNKTEGSSLERKAIVTSVTVAKAGNVNINYAIEVKDVTGEILIPQQTPQDMINIGGGYRPGTEQEDEPAHVTEFKKAVAIATSKFLKVELKDK